MVIGMVLGYLHNCHFTLSMNAERIIHIEKTTNVLICVLKLCRSKMHSCSCICLKRYRTQKAWGDWLKAFQEAPLFLVMEFDKVS